MALVLVFAMILIHDIHPQLIDARSEESSAPVSTEPPTSDHADGCEELCPCVIHVLEQSLNFSQFQTENIIATDSNWTAISLIPDSIIIKSIYRPPEA